MPAETSLNPLIEKIEDRTATVAVVGLGYVGLPLACALAGAGFHVVGIDIDPEKVQTINAGRSHVEDVPDETVRRLVTAGRLRATERFSDSRTADVAIIAVPTPVDHDHVPELAPLESAARALADSVRKGALVIVESTTYPNATEEIVAKAFRDRGFNPGVDLFIGFSPERIDPRNERWNVTNTPKIVSGLTKGCLDATMAVYSAVVDKLVPVSSLRTAEMSKLFENVFRYVNIGLVNELREICDRFDVDVWEVIAACSTKPYGFMPFHPGPGVGGHCIPVDPYYLSWKADQLGVETEFVDLAGRVNDRVPAYVVQGAEMLLSRNHKDVRGARVGLLGVAYKKNTSDVRETPATRIVELLSQKGALVTYFDPHVPAFSAGGLNLSSAPALDDFLKAQDCIILVTDHDAIDWAAVLRYAPVVVDTRNAIGKLRTAEMQQVGRTRD